VNQQRREARPESAGRYVGRVFGKRPRTYSVAPQEAARVIAYIHNNPVRAGVVSSADRSAWTSHRAFLYPAERPPWLDVTRALDLCGFSDSRPGRQGFNELVHAAISQPSGWIPCDEDLRQARRQLRRELNAPATIACPHVTPDSLEWTFPAVLDPHTPMQMQWRGDVEDLLCRVALATRISVARMRSRSRERAVSWARRIAVATWTDRLGRPLQEVARALGISSGAASKHAGAARRDPRAERLAQKVAASCWSRESFDISLLEPRQAENKLTS
jgi:hypothetical protein